ncbi:hypothetical protein E2542_SST09411 [Spatholobus suberectus]|nr:hypothetical protein E2542_SST09411 [Spatholobus suberectus]
MGTARSPRGAFKRDVDDHDFDNKDVDMDDKLYLDDDEFDDFDFDNFKDEDDEEEKPKGKKKTYPKKWRVFFGFLVQFDFLVLMDAKLPQDLTLATMRPQRSFRIAAASIWIIISDPTNDEGEWKLLFFEFSQPWEDDNADGRRQTSSWWCDVVIGIGGLAVSSRSPWWRMRRFSGFDMVVHDSNEVKARRSKRTRRNRGEYLQALPTKGIIIERRENDANMNRNENNDPSSDLFECSLFLPLSSLTPIALLPLNLQPPSLLLLFLPLDFPFSPSSFIQQPPSLICKPKFNTNS